ncbi:LacI family DNA-binding transcriptional regulator [Thermoanaerobacterium sp. DL9XJH110]|uniref:LacI family DNA-binding transcriptional regulator n=1 Tax=Thermoanaerobacterium sp. DL9XJH110 TaxID=3386643 RepID=UPI003BB5B1BC
MATIKDIAKLANVSITTVSRVLNGKFDGVSETTRKRIEKIAGELNYRPNRLARGLVTKRTNTLGLILPDITNPFFPQIVRAVEDTANKFGYNLILCNTDDDSGKERLYIQVLKEKCVDGIVFTTSTNPSAENIKQLIDFGIPFVLVDRYIDIDHLPGVYTDGVSGMYQAVKHLIEMGHEKIAFISGPKQSKTANQRFLGYVKALEEHGISVRDGLIKDGNFKMSGGQNAIKDLLACGEDFTAVACANDLMAVGAMEVLRQEGIKIPEEISITGFDNISLSNVVHPKLTTVEQPSYEMGQKATAMLVKLIEGRPLKKNEVVLKPRLIVRDSVAKRG